MPLSKDPIKAEETRRKMREAQQKKWADPEYRKRIREARTGKIQSQSDHQSGVQKRGRKFQNYVYRWIKSELKDPRISVLQPNCATVYPKDKKCPRKSLFPCLQIHTPIGSIIGDTDIVIYNKELKKPVIIISCKHSVRERITESLYYKNLYDELYGSNIKLFFVTADPDTEFGTDTKPTKPRIPAMKEGAFVFSQNPKTSFSGVVKPFDSLISEIYRVLSL